MDDSDGAVNVTSEELSRLTPGDNRELQQFIQNENQKSQVQRCKHLPQFYPLSLSNALKQNCEGDHSANQFIYPCSCPRTHRNLLQEMHYWLDIVWQARQQRGELHTKLRRKVHGLELGRTETFGAFTGWTVMGLRR
jgi:hypothetical protein